jgi:hypothetical protein
MDKTTATRTLGSGHAALEVFAVGYGCMGLDSALDARLHVPHLDHLEP